MLGTKFLLFHELSQFNQNGGALQNGVGQANGGNREKGSPENGKSAVEMTGQVALFCFLLAFSFLFIFFSL